MTNNEEYTLTQEEFDEVETKAQNHVFEEFYQAVGEDEDLYNEETSKEDNFQKLFDLIDSYPVAFQNAYLAEMGRKGTFSDEETRDILWDVLRNMSAWSFDDYMGWLDGRVQ